MKPLSARLPRFLPVLGMLLLWSLAGCTPRLSPLYRDFRVEGSPDSVGLAIRSALSEAGWEEAPPSASNAVTTAPRKLTHWGLYRIVAWLDVIPVNDRHVRVYVHPYRAYLTGGRSKIPYLNRGLERALLADLTEAFDRHGLGILRGRIVRERDRPDG